VSGTVPKALDNDYAGRFREVISDPINLLIERVPEAGLVQGSDVILHNGNRVPIVGNHSYYGGFSNILALNRGVHEPLEEYVFQEVMRRMPEAPTMLELGAYWGHYSMWLKRLRPQASVILVEPEASYIAAGKHNFNRNGFTGEFIQAFVGNGRFEVDGFLQSRGMAHLDILHVDIQSYEAEMMAGARGALDRAAIDYMFVSTHSQALHRQIIDGFTGANYRLEVSSDFEHETTSHDGFVFASSPRAQPVFETFAALGRERIVTSRPDELLASLAAIRGATRRG